MRRLISSTSANDAAATIAIGTMNSTKKWPLMPKPAASDSAIERNCGDRKWRVTVGGPVGCGCATIFSLA